MRATATQELTRIQITIIEEIKQLIEQGAIFFMSHSGGKDSQATYALLRDIIPSDQLVVLHAHLGEVEWPGVKEHIRANIDGRELNVIEANFADGSKKGFLNMVERRHAKLQADGKNAAPWPSTSARTCTSDLKRDPIHKFIKRICRERGVSLAVNVTGIRAEESTERAKLVPFEVCKRASCQSRTVYEWRPIFDLSTEEVFQVIAEAGQDAFWAYEDGNERLSCMFCIMGSPNDLAHAARVNPELFNKISRLEEKTGYTMFAKQSLAQRANIIASIK